MQSTSRLRVLSDRIPRVLVFVYFCTGVIRNYGRKAHTSGLHRDINVPHNYPTSRGVQKPRERTGDRTGLGAGRPPSSLGRPPWTRGQSQPTSWIMLHRPKGTRKTMRLMSVWSDSPHSLGRTIQPDPLAPGGEELTPLIHYSSWEKKPLIKP